MTVFFSFFRPLLQNSNLSIQSGIIRLNLHEVDEQKKSEKKLKREREWENHPSLWPHTHTLSIIILCVWVSLCVWPLDFFLFGIHRILKKIINIKNWSKNWRKKNWIEKKVNDDDNADEKWSKRYQKKDIYNKLTVVIELFVMRLLYSFYY